VALPVLVFSKGNIWYMCPLKYQCFLKFLYIVLIYEMCRQTPFFMQSEAAIPAACAPWEQVPMTPS